ncbi:RDD family protein [Treponema zioleckii]|uniref:RDD family protein n=1 Tax=Treponema zioleckii TaxID=331680 RepID=UPI00168A757C|nr:RDD family protein [Treponema zioleckii]
MKNKIELQTVKLATRRDRLFAFAIDMFILKQALALSALALGDFYARLNSWGKVLGALIALVYFGLGDSKLFGGQTLGKLAMGIRVADKHCEGISVQKSLVRSFWLFFRVTLNAPSFSSSKYILILFLEGFVFYSIWFLELYFFIVNRGTRQSLHDLIAGTFVIEAESKGEISFVNKKKAIYCSLVLVEFVFAGAICITLAAQKFGFDQSLKVQSQIQEALPVYSTSIRHSKTKREGDGTESGKKLSIRTCLKNNASDIKAIARQIGKIVSESGLASEDESCSLKICYNGYDLGILENYDTKSYSVGNIEQLEIMFTINSILDEAENKKE